MPEIDAGLVTAQRAARDESSPAGETPHAALPRRLPDVLDDDVNAAALRQLLDDGDDIVFVVIDGGFGAQVLDALELLFAAGRREHAGTRPSRELNGRLSDAAATREHEHGLVIAKTRAREQHVPRRQERQRKRRGAD